MIINWQDLYQFHWFLILGESLIIITLFHMLYRRRPATSIIAWLLAMLLLPYLFVILYFLFGHRKRAYKKAKKPFAMPCSKQSNSITTPLLDGILSHHGIPQATNNNTVSLITSGAIAYNSLLTQVASATRAIDICTYQFKLDSTTHKLIEQLTIKAQAGVSVRLLIDSMGSYQLYCWQKPLSKLRKAGAQIHFFMPMFQMPLRNYINLRNHRKIYLFDNQKLLTGGMNLAQEYMGNGESTERWLDLLFYIEGPACFYYQQIFESDWSYASKQPPTACQPAAGTNGDTAIQVLPSGPDVHGDPLFESLLTAIYAAKERIWIVTPYFIPDESLIQALLIAKQKGVDVKLITPKQSNHLIADIARSSYMRQLEEKQVDVVLYNGSMLHAKAILFDTSSVMIGSVNLDNRSLFLNYEVVSFAYSAPIINEMQQWMYSLQQRSTTGMQPAGKVRTVLENMMRIVAPQL